MRFGSPDTLRQYDKFKEEIFGKYKKEHKQRYRQSNIKPNRLRQQFAPAKHPFIRKSVVFCVLGSLLFYLNRKLGMSERVTKSAASLKYLCSPYLVHATTVLQSEIIRQFGSQGWANSGFVANAMFMDLLTTDLEICKARRQSKIISQDTNSSWALGALRGGVRETTIKISEAGEVIQQIKNCKFKLGELCMFGTRTEKVLQREKTHEWYHKAGRENAQERQTYCSYINKVNQLTLAREEYEQVLSQCISQFDMISSKISEESSRRTRRIERVNNATRCVFC